MPYVPGFTHDLFVSYASKDVEWVEEFQLKLAGALSDRGLSVDLWRDRNNIRFGQNWKEEIFKALDNTASPNSSSGTLKRLAW